MRDSTKQDIYDNLPALKEHARVLLSYEWEGEDEWEVFEIGDLMFDFNIFDWQDDNAKPIVCASVYPVIVEGHEFAKTDVSNFVPLLQKDKKTGFISNRKDITKVAQ